jgi:hypothetical protein
MACVGCKFIRWFVALYKYLDDKKGGCGCSFRGMYSNAATFFFSLALFSVIGEGCDMFIKMTLGKVESVVKRERERKKERRLLFQTAML